MKPRILVVEDNPANSELLCAWLETEGYDVATAADLQAAFASIQETPVDAVLLDIQLGCEDGAPLAAWVRQQEHCKHIPVIAVTAHAMMAERQRVLQAGCNACVLKPIDFRDLRQQLITWLAISASSSRFVS